MLNNITDNLEQCGQQNIVQSCLYQARTGCSFFAVYMAKNYGTGTILSFLYVCMVNTIYLLSLRIESSAIINLRGVSTKLNK